MAAAQNTYISIDKIAELKGLKSNRTLRIAINKINTPQEKFLLKAAILMRFYFLL